MSELTAKEFLEIKKRICYTHKHCVKCEFYYACHEIVNSTEHDIDKALKFAEEVKEED